MCFWNQGSANKCTYQPWRPGLFFGWCCLPLDGDDVVDGIVAYLIYFHILSYILPYVILSYLMLSYLILSYLILSDLILCYLMLSCPILCSCPMFFIFFYFKSTGLISKGHFLCFFEHIFNICFQHILILSYILPCPTLHITISYLNWSKN